MASSDQAAQQTPSKPIKELDDVAIRFAGDSGDGMQLVGTQFSNVSAVFGNDISTLPDYPAEIRAPAGTLAGVSGYQIHFSSSDIYTPGDKIDALVAMNPAALRTNLGDLDRGGILIVNSDAFDKSDLAKAGYEVNPLEDGSLDGYQLFRIEMTRINRNAVADVGLSTRDADRCKNFFALGLVFWLYDRPLEPTLQWINQKFGKNPAVADANTRSLNAGYNYGETTEAFVSHYRVAKAPLKPGKYRSITGNEATAYGMLTAAKLAGKELFYATYPITPASDILHELAKHKNFGVRTVQAEDEIAAICAVIGASFGGAFAVTGTSGPGVALKSEGIGLGIMTELPMVIVCVQRGGPSTGLPTKTEQADLFQACFGRNGESPLVVLAPATPTDCFTMIQEAFRLAVNYMTPVFFLSDGYLANGAEPWLIPRLKDLEPIAVHHPAPRTNGESNGFYPYQRNERLARPWAIPGTAGLEHRIGGLEKEDVTGNVSYDPANHQHMVELRARKIAGIAGDVPEVEVDGPAEGDVLVVGWGGTYGALATAVHRCQQAGKKVAHAHIRYLNPLPRNLGDVLKRYRRVLVAELNLGQLLTLLRAKYLVDAVGLNKIQGKPFLVSEVTQKIDELLQ